MDAADTQIDRPIAKLAAILRVAGDVAVRTARHFRRRAGEIETIFHLKTDGAAKCVQAEGRVVALQRESAHGKFGNEIPVDCIAESLVHTRTVLIDGDAFCYARDWRGFESAIIEIWLELAALLVVQT